MSIRTTVQHVFKHPDDPQVGVIFGKHDCQCGDPDSGVPPAECCQPYRDTIPSTEQAKRDWLAANPGAATVSLAPVA